MIESIIEASDPAIAVYYARQVLLRRLENLPEFLVGKSIVRKIKDKKKVR